jgi:hypothetical protein
MSVRIPVVMPVKAGIQALFLDSRWEHAGMTTGDNGHFRASCKTLQNSMVKTCPSGSSMTIFATEATRDYQVIDLTRF